MHPKSLLANIGVRKGEADFERRRCFVKEAQGLSVAFRYSFSLGPSTSWKGGS